VRNDAKYQQFLSSLRSLRRCEIVFEISCRYDFAKLNSPPHHFKGFFVKHTVTPFLTLAVLVCLTQHPLHAQTTADTLSTVLTDSLKPGMVYVSHIALNFVSVIDPTTNQIIRKIKSHMGPCCVAISPHLDHGYIADFMADDLTVFNRATGESTGPISAGVHPSSILLTADGRYLLIGHESNDGLWFLDTQTNEVVKRLNEGTGTLCGDKGGKKIYQSQISIPFVFVIDPSTQSIERRIYVGGRPLDLALAPDEKSLYVANYNLNEVDQIDTRSDTVVARIARISTPRGIAVTNDGNFAYVTNVKLSAVTVIDLAADTVARIIPVGAFPTSVAMLPGGDSAYVACQGGDAVYVIDTRTQKVARLIVVESNPIRTQVW